MAILCVVPIALGNTLAGINRTQQSTGSEQAARIPNEQLDSLVAPIALYPDPLLSQTLVASTYPLEIMQLQQWLSRNTNLKDKALADAVSKQPWDPSVQAMAAHSEATNLSCTNVSLPSNVFALLLPHHYIGSMPSIVLCAVGE